MLKNNNKSKTFDLIKVKKRKDMSSDRSEKNGKWRMTEF